MPPSPSEPNAVRLQDVANALDLSVMTVSRAMRGLPNVHPKTAERVRKTAQAMGYRPNPMVQTLMSGIRRGKPESTANLAWVTKRKAENPGVQKMRKFEQFARLRAEQLGYCLVHFELDAEMNAQSLRHIFNSQGIRGIVVEPLQVPGGTLDLPYSDFPYVTIGRSMPKPLLHHSMPHHYHAVLDLLQIMRGRGYRRIGLIVGEDNHARVENAHAMAFAYDNTQRAPKWRVPTVIKPKWNTQKYKDYLKKHKPDAVIAEMSYVSDRLGDAGAKIPEDIGVASLSWEANRPQVSGIRSSMEAICASAIDTLVGQIQRNEFGVPRFPKTTLIEGEWVEGNTLRPPN